MTPAEYETVDISSIYRIVKSLNGIRIRLVDEHPTALIYKFNENCVCTTRYPQTLGT